MIMAIVQPDCSHKFMLTTFFDKAETIEETIHLTTLETKPFGHAAMPVMNMYPPISFTAATRLPFATQ
jgi:hypothetical protein